MSATELLALADRCEQATGPDRELDAAICAAFGISLNPPNMEGVLGEPFCRITDDERRVRFGTVLDGVEHSLASRDPLPVTTSLDAVMTLIPKSWRWWKAGDGATGGSRMVVVDGEDANGRWSCFGECPCPEMVDRNAGALCAAALRARAAHE